MFCSQCGTQTPEGSRFCPDCGSSLEGGVTNGSSKPQSPLLGVEATARIRSQDIETMAGLNGGYYAAKFESMYPDGNIRLKPNWNWSAFLCAAVWMVYRKMYIEAAATVIVLGFFLPTGFLVPLGWVACGAMGNALYLMHLQRQWNQASAAARRNNQHIYETQAALSGGGTNEWVKPVAIVIVVLTSITTCASILSLMSSGGGW